MKVAGSGRLTLRNRRFLRKFDLHNKQTIDYEFTPSVPVKRPQNTVEPNVVQLSHTEQLLEEPLDQYHMVEEVPVQPSAVGHPQPLTAQKEIIPVGQCPEQMTRPKRDRKQRQVYDASTGKYTNPKSVPEGI